MSRPSLMISPTLIPMRSSMRRSAGTSAFRSAIALLDLNEPRRVLIRRENNPVAITSPCFRRYPAAAHCRDRGPVRWRCVWTAACILRKRWRGARRLELLHLAVSPSYQLTRVLGRSVLPWSAVFNCRADPSYREICGRRYRSDNGTYCCPRYGPRCPWSGPEALHRRRRHRAGHMAGRYAGLNLR